jgi:hypothetical protein
MPGRPHLYVGIHGEHPLQAVEVVDPIEQAPQGRPAVGLEHPALARVVGEHTEHVLGADPVQKPGQLRLIRERGQVGLEVHDAGPGRLA